jgi:hypothetical protein
MRKPYKRSMSDSLLHAVGLVIGGLYKLLFSSLEERSYQRNRRRFLVNVNDNFSELLSERGGRVYTEESEKPPRARVFDYVTATLEFADLRFHLVAGRGELAVYIAPASDPSDWQDLGTLVYWEARGGTQSPECIAFLYQTARYIQSHWDELVKLYAVENRSVIGLKRTRLSGQLSSSSPDRDFQEPKFWQADR